ncbi:transcriptional regulator family: Zinc finger MIZ-type [Penicillium bovifimosum]|uniref:Transcriptional regulator family: Zinc finger MIZ-type n=1 Tax=Penicillium bovifimosum TaxID=126998 RepID=A0A9W9H5M1_9EURO|nr:transcriptional regulator family: Zinc finger MIZ-type [Penicillium bovifimosum]KAJ5139105.1 transcriptional regulator family: Zinc finger MIZ-type [Penicillium bovifimosum]
MATSSLSSEVTTLISFIKTLTNPQLKVLLRYEGLPVSGLKATLQFRIIQRLQYLSESDSVGFDTLARRIRATTFPNTVSYQSPTGLYQPAPVSQSPAQGRSTAHGISMSPLSYTSGPSAPLMNPPAAAHKSPGPLVFKDSPFYTILEPLTPVVECKVREQTRDSVELKVMLSQQVAYRLQTDPNIRIMVYCAGDSGLTQYTKSDIAFPHQVELKVNLDEVKANLRGLKNRPGTTQPADITDWIRKKPNYPNNIVMTYALTQKKFFTIANLVKRHPIDDLVSQLKLRKLISKEQVIREMQNRANDSEIVATSSVMSLKCPLSTLRIQVPCRSIICTHNQCFDASSFLELQKQAPTWTCPVCSKSTSFESLQVDQYVDDILQSTSSDIDQVTVEPDGVWSTPIDSDAGKLGGMTPTSEDEDDLIEISEPGNLAVKQEPSAPNGTLERTPAQSQSREASTPSSVMRMSSKKRPISQVIDLTESGDEEDESPAPPTKRTALNLPPRPFPRQEYHIPPARSPLNGSYPP